MEASLDIKSVTDQTGILLLEDNNDEHCNTKYPLIDMELTSQSLPITSCQLNLMRGKAWKIMSVIAEFLHWHHERWNVRTALPFQLGSRFITVAMYWSISRIELDWVDQTFVRSARSWIDYQHLVYLTTLAYIFTDSCTTYLPPAHIVQMADQYGLMPEDYISDLKLLSIIRYTEGILFLILLFLK